MNEEPDVYHAYLLRLRRVLCQGEWRWRASLESPHTGERQTFASLSQLFAFLCERFDGQAGNKPEEGEKDEYPPIET